VRVCNQAIDLEVMQCSKPAHRCPPLQKWFNLVGSSLK
jgi:hypothetical protein